MHERVPILSKVVPLELGCEMDFVHNLLKVVVLPGCPGGRVVAIGDAVVKGSASLGLTHEPGAID
jgi:hypothetical protein